ncbi:TRAP-type mannitol/chloroaromatic compound transport system substrate-binding protein [Rhodovulum imhoffii]|uniref:TRAP-type mannitol/chloroaromatic compound transport system substrate-binding protein n=1 Tax=Rhodovulum imhoffii TaxID=365340 RepID=A0A2T5BVG5_9RHOB|nr:TRAP transporter substrate-binding protein [Rhodovulum imhoffii]MBK5932859.1 ABC transporter substrate-binding protein [Rhodovulum imhoffii]PTN03572.1 TRAP-type mannitol/chloroaromatic compound transport system substrate-binding protein [Rhodovulum imhoffii]
MNTTVIVKGIAFGIAASIGLASVAAAETVRLRFHTFYGTEMDEFAKKMRDTVKEASGGDLRIQYFRGGELVASDQFVDAVSKGTIDIAYGVGSYWGGQLDLGNIEAGLPGAWTTAEEARALFEDKGLDTLLAEAYAGKGVKLIGRGYGSNYDLLTKEPVNSLEDLKSMKIRATGQMAKVLEAFDIPTVYLPAQELYIGLSTGVIDGAIYGGPVEYEQLKLHEAATHYTFLNLLNPGWIETVIINPDVWEGLSETHRQILRDAIDQYAADIHNWLEEGNQKIVQDGDIFEFSTLPAEDSARLTEAAQSVWQEEAAKSERNARAVEILAENARAEGRLK